VAAHLDEVHHALGEQTGFDVTFAERRLGEHPRIGGGPSQGIGAWVT
jgi:hypothetical protein